MTKIFLTSDLHLGHANVIKYCSRPFRSQDEVDRDIILPESVRQMDETLIKNWNSAVGPEDTVYVLGDLSLSIEAAKRYLPRLRGKIHLIAGNHDHCHPAHKRGRTPELLARATNEYLVMGIQSVTLESMIAVPNMGQWRMVHMPYYDPDDMKNGVLRHGRHRLKDDGVPILCGHVHEKWLFKITPDGTPMVNVGVDAPDAPWSGQFRPATLEEVAEVCRRVIDGG